MRAWLIAALLLCLSVSVAAQETSPNRLVEGTAITGRLDDTLPRITYRLDGTRGTVVRLRLNATSGDLDPVLALFDPAGRAVLLQDDHDGQRGITVTITYQQTGAYQLVIGRFGYSLGVTSGEFSLLVENIGISATDGALLQYGTPITGTITNAQMQRFYTFRARAGDILNVEMVRSSGRLDPFLQVVDSQRFLVAENDDANGDTKNSRIENLLIEEDGLYIIVATRYGQAAGTSAGSFVLLIEEAGGSGIGNNQQAPQRLRFDQSVSGELDDERYERYYSFEGQRDQLVTLTMDFSGERGFLDAYLILANAGFQPLIEDDDSGAGQNARISRYRLPASGLYHIIVTRFDGADGDSSGSYVLTLRDGGSAFAGVSPDIPRLLYGTTVEDDITEFDRDSLFVFWGVAGEEIIITMDRRDNSALDPFLELLDANRVRMVFDDDGGFQTNARLEAELTYTGVHFIRASANPASETFGSYRMALIRR